MFPLPENIARAKADEGRLCPMIAGPAVLIGGCLTVRLPDAFLEIRGQPAILRKVVNLCDGTRSLREMTETLPSTSRPAVTELLNAMLEAGALIDASLYVAHALNHGNLNSPYGRSVTDEVAQGISWRKDADSSMAYTVAPGPMDDLVKARVSARTFSGEAISFDVLRSLLWTMCGVVEDQHGWLGGQARRRTLASGGALNLVQPFLALRLTVGPLEPGFYRVGYPGAKQISFTRLDSDIDRLPLAIARPAILTHAIGAVFLLGDINTAALRYRNRAVKYLFMEAGAAMQNLALCAKPLGVGVITIGGHDEREVAALCQHRDALVLTAAVFGGEPYPEQLTMLRERSIDAQTSWMPTRGTRYSLPFHFAVAKTSNVEGESPFSWGRDTHPWLAHVKAMAEAVEREAYRYPKNLHFGALRDFGNAIAPGSLVRYSTQQLAQPSFPFGETDERAIYPWVAGADANSGREVLVPADFIFSRKSISTSHTLGRRITHANSSGCAAGCSEIDARDRSLLEVIERDAFMRHWLGQFPGVQLDPASLPQSLSARLAQLAGSGWRIILQRFSSPVAPVVCASAQHMELGMTCVGAAASLSITEAAEKALSEIESAAFGCHIDPPSLKLSPAQVKVPADHAALYRQRRYFQRADAILNPTKMISLTEAEAEKRNTSSLLALVESAGLRPIFVDITPRRNAINQGRTALTVLKCLVPGLVPISFGVGLEPRGMVKTVHPRSFFPHPFP